MISTQSIISYLLDAKPTQDLHTAFRIVMSSKEQPLKTIEINPFQQFTKSEGREKTSELGHPHVCSMASLTKVPTLTPTLKSLQSMAQWSIKQFNNFWWTQAKQRYTLTKSLGHITQDAAAFHRTNSDLNDIPIFIHMNESFSFYLY